jgi:two-component system OmpR family sensor kinase
MLKKQSIYKEFATKLIVATSLFVLTISFIFYGFTKTTIYEGVVDGLLEKAKLVYKISQNLIDSNEQLKILVEKDLSIDLIQIHNLSNTKVRQYKNITKKFH